VSGGDASDEGEVGVPDLPPGVAVSLRRADVWTAPPAHLFDRIAAAVNSTARADAPSSKLVAARRRWVLVGAAAAALVLFAAGFVVRGIADDGPDESAGDDTPVAQLALAGTDLAPMAKAGVEVLDRGDGYALVLATEGLAPAPDGMYYEGWLRSAGGDSVSIGTFHLRGGDGTVVLWSGVAIDDFPTLTVTLRDVPPGGVAEAGSGGEGDPVLVGSLDEATA
jgi:hypothetical protein